MDFEFVRQHCLKRAGVTETFPFGEETPVYKVMSKIFLIANLDYPVSINLKCDPELAVELRERYDSVTPGYHMNKMHWNTVVLDNSIPDGLVVEWIDHSYEIVVTKLKKSEKEELKNI